MGTCSTKLQLSPDLVLEIGAKKNQQGAEAITMDLLQLQAARKSYDKPSRKAIDQLVTRHIADTMPNN